MNIKNNRRRSSKNTSIGNKHTSTDSLNSYADTTGSSIVTSSSTLSLDAFDTSCEFYDIDEYGDYPPYNDNNVNDDAVEYVHDDDIDDIDNCDHDYQNGMCVLCGAIEILDNCINCKNTNSHFLLIDDFISDQAIKNRSREISAKLGTFRENKRRLATFYSVYQAYMECRRPIPPEYLRIKMGFSIKELNPSKAMSLFSEVNTGYRPKDIYLTPESYINFYCELCCINNKDICKIEELCKKSATLSDKFPPHKIMAAIVTFAIQHELVDGDISQQNHISKSDIVKIEKQLSLIFND